MNKVSHRGPAGPLSFPNPSGNAWLHDPPNSLTERRSGPLAHSPPPTTGFTREGVQMQQQAIKRPFAHVAARVPRAYLVARVAARPAGWASKLNQHGSSLHFTILLEDFRGYAVYGFDGQPDDIFQAPSKKLIVSNFYRNREPSGILFRHFLVPPYIVGYARPIGDDRSAEERFADELANAAHNFFSSTEHYSFPANIVGRRMLNGEYNSSSFIAGLLNYVMGYIPKVSAPGYQMPGWESPIPSHYFRSGPNGAPR